MKIWASLLLAVSEAVCIYAELYMSALSTKSWMIQDIIKPSIIVMLGSLGLLAGYYSLYKLTNSVWVPSIVSLGAIFITEPILVYFMFGEMPTLKIIISMVFVIIGIILSLV